MRSVIITAALFLATVGCNPGGAADNDARAAGKNDSSGPLPPEETRPPNADWQTPAFENQTRAPRPATNERWSVETIAEDLEHPWAIEILPDGSFLVTERPGRLRHVSSRGEIGEPISGVPKVRAYGQGGLLDVALAPDFAESRRIYLSYAEPRDDSGKTGTSVARGVLGPDHQSLNDVQVIFRQQPSWESRGHYGSRIVIAPDGTLYVTLGERMTASDQAQDPSNHLGAVVRINPDGSVPEDNPFVGDESGADEVFSYGHRNLQAADIHPETGELWTVEHGPRGGDELNQPKPGGNHGWPVVSYGEEYSGERIGKGITRKQGVVQPVYYWDPVIAPSGMDFYEGDAFPAWKGDLFIGGLASEKVVRLVLEEGRVVAEEWLPIGERVRDVKEARDGTLYLVTDEDNGKVLRIVPVESGQTE